MRTGVAGWWAHAGAVVDAVAERRDVIVVSHSLGGFTAPLVCARIPADLLILLAGMIPSTGEVFDDWWSNAGYEPSGFDDRFYHDVPPKLVAEARRRGGRRPLRRSQPSARIGRTALRFDQRSLIA